MRKNVWTPVILAIALLANVAGSHAFAQPGRGGSGGGRAAPDGRNSLSNTAAFSHAHHRSGASSNELMSPWSIDQQFDCNPQLASRLAKAFPPATDIRAAAAGFKDFFQFMTTVQASNNLGIPFEQMKATILAGVPLPEAIQLLKPEANASREARRAEREAQKVEKQIQLAHTPD